MFWMNTTTKYQEVLYSSTLNKYKRIFHHIDFKEAKGKHLEDLAVKKLEEERKVKQEKEISKIVEEKKYSWRDTLTEAEWVALDTGGIANKTTQTFGLTDFGMPVMGPDFSQVTANFGGLGGVDVHPSEVGYNGMEGEPQTTPPPTYNQLALAGFTKPLPMFRRNSDDLTVDEINARLDAGEEVARRSNADVLMKARVEKWMNEYKPGDPVWSNDGIIIWNPKNDPDIEPDTYQNYMPKKGIDLEWFRQGGTNIDARYYRWGGGDASVKAGLTFDQVYQRGIEYANQFMTDKEANIESGTKNWNFVGPVYDPVEDGKNWDHRGVTADDEKFLKANQTLVDLTKWMNNIGLPNDFAQWTLNYANNDMTPITKFSPGMERQVWDLVMKKFSKNPNATVVDIEYKDYGWKFDALPTRLGLGRFTATKLDNGDIRIEDTFNVDKVATHLGAAQIVPGLQDTADRLVDIAYKRRSIGGVFDEGGIPINVIIRKKKKKAWKPKLV